MENDFLEMIETTPKIHTTKCKIISLLIRSFLQFATISATLFSWYIYDYFIAFFTMVFSFLIVGIIRSKLRNSVIPVKQREYQYNDKGIADWYTSKVLCI